MTPTIATGVYAAVIAALLVKFQIIPWLGMRVAAVCGLVVGAALSTAAGIGHHIAGALTWLDRAAGHVVSLVDPRIGGFLAGNLTGLVILVLALLWLVAMLPKMASKWVGPSARREFDTWLVVAGVLLPLFATTVPGSGVVHQFVGSGVNLGVSAGTYILTLGGLI